MRNLGRLQHQHRLTLFYYNFFAQSVYNTSLEHKVRKLGMVQYIQRKVTMESLVLFGGSEGWDFKYNVLTDLSILFSMIKFDSHSYYFLINFLR